MFPASCMTIECDTMNSQPERLDDELRKTRCRPGRHCSPHLRQCPAAPCKVCSLTSTTIARQIARKTCTACIYSGRYSLVSPRSRLSRSTLRSPSSRCSQTSRQPPAHQAEERNVPVCSSKVGRLSWCGDCGARLDGTGNYKMSGHVNGERCVLRRTGTDMHPVFYSFIAARGGV